MLQISAENETAIQNLLLAFEEESNANARYSACAARADTEEFKGIASLFRATARAEHIHAANHARVIRQLGEKPWCTIHVAPLGGTLENLKAALAFEEYEIDFSYPAILEEEKAMKDSDLLRTLKGALEAAKTHARLFSEAIALMESEVSPKSGVRQTSCVPSKCSAPLKCCGNVSWVRAVRSFYVCPHCGAVAKTRGEFDLCPVCRGAMELFEEMR